MSQMIVRMIAWWWCRWCTFSRGSSMHTGVLYKKVMQMPATRKPDAAAFAAASIHRIERELHPLPDTNERHSPTNNHHTNYECRNHFTADHADEHIEGHDDAMPHDDDAMPHDDTVEDLLLETRNHKNTPQTHKHTTQTRRPQRDRRNPDDESRRERGDETRRPTVRCSQEPQQHKSNSHRRRGGGGSRRPSPT